MWVCVLGNLASLAAMAASTGGVFVGLCSGDRNLEEVYKDCLRKCPRCARQFSEPSLFPLSVQATTAAPRPPAMARPLPLATGIPHPATHRAPRPPVRPVLISACQLCAVHDECQQHQHSSKRCSRIAAVSCPT